MYWEQKGRANTAATAELALKRAKELGIKQIVVASNSGYTAEQFLDKGVEVICVTHHIGFMSPGEDEMRPQVRQRLTEQGSPGADHHPPAGRC